MSAHPLRLQVAEHGCVAMDTEPGPSGHGKTAVRPWLTVVPAGLIACRVVLGPCLGWLAGHEPSAWVVISVLTAAMLSDLFDGIIARRLGIATAKLRVADSRADAWFFLCVGWSAWLAAPDVIRAYSTPLLASVSLQLFSYVYDLVRYHRITSLHAYSAKVWGFSLYVTSGALIAFHFGALIWVSFALGLVSFADAAAIKLLLPGWRHDVLSCAHAYRQRRTEGREAR